MRGSIFDFAFSYAVGDRDGIPAACDDHTASVSFVEWPQLARGGVETIRLFC
jgi:hypothetical protein